MCKVDTVCQVQRFCSGCSGKTQNLQHNSTKKLPNLSMETLTSTHLVLLSESRQPNRTPQKVLTDSVTGVWFSVGRPDIIFTPHVWWTFSGDGMIKKYKLKIRAI